jgi:uncharacterized membrane protein
MKGKTPATSAYAVAAILVSASCYLNLLGMEKALLVFVLAFLGLKQIKEQDQKGANLIYLAIILAVVFLFVVFLYTRAAHNLR